jgi:hypothetical protein
VKDWQHDPDHRIAGTEHGTLHFADGITTVIADWQAIDDAPDAQGRIYRTIRGWATTWTDPERRPDNSPLPPPLEARFPKGRAQLHRTDLRGQPTLTDREVVCYRTVVTPPYPNTWDHPGLLLSMTWLDRNAHPGGDTTAPAWWPMIHQRIRRHSAVLADLLNDAHPIADGDLLWLRLDAQNAAEVRAANGEKLMARSLRHPGGPRITRRIELGTPAQSLPAPSAAR